MKIKTEGYKSVAGATKALNFAIYPHTKGIFRDAHWNPVQNILKELEKIGWVEFMGWQLTRYEHDTQGNPNGKSWVGPVEITIQNEFEAPKRVTRWLNIRASFLDKNGDTYDLVAYIS